MVLKAFCPKEFPFNQYQNEFIFLSISKFSHPKSISFILHFIFLTYCSDFFLWRLKCLRKEFSFENQILVPFRLQKHLFKEVKFTFLYTMFMTFKNFNMLLNMFCFLMENAVPFVMYLLLYTLQKCKNIEFIVIDSRWKIYNLNVGETKIL